MKIAIVYYSYSGNTKKIADALADYLKPQGTVQMIELKALDESNNFFAQASRAFWHKKAEITVADFNLSHSDLVCFGTPVWAFAPAPAMNTYLDKCWGLPGKEVILFTTYGSGAGRERCLNYMQDILAKKGAQNFKRLHVQQFKVGEQELVKKIIKEAGI
jgi:flavodoxin